MNATAAARVLVVDDDMDSRTIAGEILRTAGYEVRSVPDAKEALTFLGREKIDAVLSDIRMRECTGFDLLWMIRKHYPGLPVILMTAFPSLESAVESVKKGALEYLSKPLQPEELGRILQRSIAKADAAPASSRNPQEEPTFIVGRSPAIVQVYKTVARAAQSRSPVLIEGETGTGKQLVARALHQAGPRAGRPFVEVNCAAIPETLIESELFGHVRGAFTGADADHAGLFEQAHGGTLFLDEIGHIGRSMLAKLLKAIEDGTVRRVGAAATMSVDLRLVSASSRPIRDLVQTGQFLAEAYYRLNAVTIQLPALRERTEDVPLLARHFLARYLAPEKKGTDFSEAAMGALMRHAWPGNVRELEQTVRRAAEFASGPAITAEDLGLAAPRIRMTEGEIRSLADLERDHICRVLEFTQGNRQKAAEILGIDRKTLYRKLLAAGLSAERE